MVRGAVPFRGGRAFKVVPKQTHYREHLSKPNVNLQEVNEGSQLGSVERNVLAVLDKRKENNPFEEFLLGSLYRAFLSERIPMLWDLDTVIGGFNANLDYLEAMASLGEYGSEKWDFFRIFPLGIPNNTTSSEFLHGDREFFDSFRHESGVYSKVDKRSLKYSNFGLVFEITDFNSALKLFAPYLKAAGTERSPQDFSRAYHVDKFNDYLRVLDFISNDGIGTIGIYSKLLTGTMQTNLNNYDSRKFARPAFRINVEEFVHFFSGNTDFLESLRNKYQELSYHLTEKEKQDFEKKFSPLLRVNPKPYKAILYSQEVPVSEIGESISYEDFMSKLTRIRGSAVKVEVYKR